MTSFLIDLLWMKNWSVLKVFDIGQTIVFYVRGFFFLLYFFPFIVHLVQGSWTRCPRKFLHMFSHNMMRTVFSHFMLYICNFFEQVNLIFNFAQKNENTFSLNYHIDSFYLKSKTPVFVLWNARSVQSILTVDS